MIELTNWEREQMLNLASINYSQKANHLEDAIIVELAQKRLVIIRQSKAIVQDSEQKELVSGPDSRSPHRQCDD